MKGLLAALALLAGLVLAAGCATFQSPFKDSELTDTRSSDVHRNFLTGQAISQYVRRGDFDSRSTLVLNLAAGLDACAMGAGATVTCAIDLLKNFVNTTDLHPDDLDLVKYFAELLAQQADLDLSLTDEQRRVLGVHAARIRAKVAELGA